MANRAKIVPSTGTVKWSNASAFDGHLLLGLAPPEGVSRLFLNGEFPPRELPQWVRIPIEKGVIHDISKVLFNSEIEPPNSKYCAFWYDLGHLLLSGPSSLFTIEADPYTITVPTLTIPAASVSPPVPGSVPVPPVVVYPVIETPEGVKNGTNPTFFLSRVPTYLASVWLNGMVLEEGVGFTRSGKTITMQAGYIPSSGDSLRALVW